MFHILAKQIAAKKVKTLKPVVKSDRNTQSMQKKDDENMKVKIRFSENNLETR